MNDDKYLELVNKDIDGVLTPNEKAELEKILSESPAAKTLHEDLSELCNLLSQVETVEPSPNLKKVVLNSIPKNKYTQTQIQSSRPNFLSRVLNVDFRFIYSFAAGLVFGLVLLIFVGKGLEDGSGLDPSELTGTLILTGDTKGFKFAEKLEIEHPNVTGTIETKFNEKVVVVEIDLAMEIEIDLTLLFDETDLRFKGFRHSEDKTSNLALTPNALKLTLAGANQYSLVFENESERISKITLKIFGPGGNYEGNLATGLSRE